MRRILLAVPFKECWRKRAVIRQVLQQFTPVVEGASVDEWYLDLMGTEGVYHQLGCGGSRRCLVCQNRRDPWS